LSAADDRLRLSAWLPPQEGVIPRVRLGSRWINVLWALPLVVALLILGVAVAQQLRTVSGVQEFLVRYPGLTPASEAVYSGFPLWVRLLHMFNFFLMMFIIRAGNVFELQAEQGNVAMSSVGRTAAAESAEG
jgi:hypothetical protein